MWIFRVKFASGYEKEFTLCGSCVADRIMLHAGLDEAIRRSEKYGTMVDTFEVVGC